VFPKWIVENKPFCEGLKETAFEDPELSILQDSKIVCPKDTRRASRKVGGEQQTPGGEFFNNLFGVEPRG